MRRAFIEALCDLAQHRNEVWALTADLGYGLFDPFVTRFPERFVNVGVAEANMVSVAAGLAARGKRPVVYTACSFLTTRALEQIKIDLCYHRLPVVCVGGGAGYGYGENGPTHHSLEDIALMRSLDGMTVVCPADRIEAREALRASLEADGPVYLRLARTGNRPVHQGDVDFQVGRAIVVREGKDAALLATGEIVCEALAAADSLRNQGIDLLVASVHTVAPLDVDFVRDCAGKHDIVFTVEEHAVTGGLGSAVAEVIAEEPGGARLVRLGVRGAFVDECGDQQYFLRLKGLTGAQIAADIAQAVTGSGVAC